MRTREDATRRCAQIVTARKTSYRYRWRLGDAFVDYGDALPSDRSSPSRVKAILGALRRRERQQRRLERLCRHPRASQSFLRGGLAPPRSDPPSAPNLLLCRRRGRRGRRPRAREQRRRTPAGRARDVEVREARDGVREWPSRFRPSRVRISPTRTARRCTSRRRPRSVG